MWFHSTLYILATNITGKRSLRFGLDAPDHDSPEKGLSAPKTKRFSSYSGDYKLILDTFQFTAVRYVEAPFLTLT